MTTRDWSNFVFQLSRLKTECRNALLSLDDNNEEGMYPLTDIRDRCDFWLDWNQSNYIVEGRVAEEMQWANLAIKYLRRGEFNGYAEHSTEWA